MNANTADAGSSPAVPIPESSVCVRNAQADSETIYLRPLTGPAHRKIIQIASKDILEDGRFGCTGAMRCTVRLRFGAAEAIRLEQEDT